MCSYIDNNDCYVESMCVCMLSVLLLFISLVLPAANMEGGLVEYLYLI